MTSAQVRERLVRALQLNLVGPERDEPDYAAELLPEPPTSWYLTGFLTPRGAPAEQRSDPEAQDELDDGANEHSDLGGTERPSARRSKFPASLGMTAFVDADARELTVELTWGDYLPEPSPDLPVPAVAGEGEPTATEEPGEPSEAADTQQWRRVARAEAAVLPLGAGASQTWTVPESDGLRVYVEVQPVSELATGEDKLPLGTRSVSVFLVNERTADSEHLDERCIFQARLRLRVEGGFLGRPNLRGQGDLDDWDESLADLQYRDCLEYAVGHGVATRVVERATPDGRVPAVETCWLPRAEVERIEAPPVESVELRLETLAALPAAEIEPALGPLVDQYRAWLERQHTSLAGLSQRRQDVGQALLNDAQDAAQRMAAGLALLRDDARVLSAFQTVNRCMAQAQRRRRAATEGRRPEALPPPAWRPFQLAFQLMCLPELVDPTHPRRRTVDLLFFPTGGGKTEAYLGLAAFCLVWRRLTHEAPTSGGLSVLMRYTLRLLTLDQLERAAGLVCALELERQARPAELGEWPFEIGLWVGGAATPNRLGYEGYQGPGKTETAQQKLKRYRIDDDRNPSPVPLVRCPWCGDPLGKGNLRLEPNEVRPQRLTIYCQRVACEFSQQPLPILVVDEVIYRRLPAFIIATLDKFATLPWDGRVGGLFGRVERYDRDGYYGPSTPGVGQQLPAGCLPPPDLIIQDELHLISGPLGTVAGLYEAAISLLASRPGSPMASGPKLVASTATVRRARAQIKALFGRGDTSIFPPPVPNRRDSFFAQAKSEEDAPARWYVGAAAQGRSHKALLRSTALTLLGASAQAWHEATERSASPADPYLTMLGYFNSLRELGGSRHLVEDQVYVQIQQYARRQRLEPAEALFDSREISREPLELTSRVSTAEVAAAKARLAAEFGPPASGAGVDVALATNMISVGLDIGRLGLMVVHGQPKAAAEYIQATSRVGRERDKPGLIVTLLNPHKPRDRSHYERYTPWHEAFYREVEPTSVTPLAARALDRALAGVLVGVIRHALADLNPPGAAIEMADLRTKVDTLMDQMVAQLLEHGGPEAGASRADLRARLSALSDDWAQIAAQALSTQSPLIYQRTEGNETGEGKVLVRDWLDAGLAELGPRERAFRANRSMRDVEPSVDLWIQNWQGED